MQYRRLDNALGPSLPAAPISILLQNPSIIILVFRRLSLRPVLTYRYLDALAGKALAERRALDDAGELLRGEDLEFVAENPGQNWRFALGRAGHANAGADVDEVHLESGV